MNENELPRHPIVALIVFVPSIVLGFYGAGVFGVVPYNLGLTNPYLICWFTAALNVVAVLCLAGITLKEFVKNIAKGMFRLPRIRSFFFLGLCIGMMLFSALLVLAMTIGTAGPPLPAAVTDIAVAGIQPLQQARPNTVGVGAGCLLEDGLKPITPIGSAPLVTQSES